MCIRDREQGGAGLPVLVQNLVKDVLGERIEGVSGLVHEKERRPLLHGKYQRELLPHAPGVTAYLSAQAAGVELQPLREFEPLLFAVAVEPGDKPDERLAGHPGVERRVACLLYTSDAADDLLC